MEHLQLASQSPRRAELLTQIGVQFRVVNANTDETPAFGEAPYALVERLAGQKAQAGFAASPGLPTLGADTLVICDGQIFGKPKDEDDALRMLTQLSGREHEVVTAVAVCNSESVERLLVHSFVHFIELSPAEIRAYWRSGEPQDKAGAYAIQGLGAIFVSAIRGSYSNIVGLPLYETAALLRQFGIKTPLDIL